MRGWTLCPVLRGSCLDDTRRAGCKVLRLSSLGVCGHWVCVTPVGMWVPDTGWDGPDKPSGDKKGWEVKADRQQESPVWRGNVKVKRTRLSKPYDSRGGGHRLVDKTTLSDKALGAPKVCWLWVINHEPCIRPQASSAVSHRGLARAAEADLPCFLYMSLCSLYSEFFCTQCLWKGQVLFWQHICKSKRRKKTPTPHFMLFVVW